MSSERDADRPVIDSLRRIAIFAKVVEAGSLRAAAGRLGLSTSVISHHLSGLEEDVGAVLLDRTTRRITLTQDGAMMLAAARDILQAARGAFQSVGRQNSAFGGQLKVTLPTVLSRAPFLKSIKSLETQFPRLTLSLGFLDGFSGPLEAGSDVVFFCGPIETEQFRCQKVADFDRKIVASPAYIERRTAPSTMDTLLAADWIWPRYEAKILPYLAHQKSQKVKRVKVRPRTLVDDAMVCRRLALEGIGLTIMPDFVVDEDISLGRLEPVMPQLRLSPEPLWVTAVEDPSKAALVRFFIKFVTDSLNSH